MKVTLEAISKTTGDTVMEKDFSVIEMIKDAADQMPLPLRVLANKGTLIRVKVSQGSKEIAETFDLDDSEPGR